MPRSTSDRSLVNRWTLAFLFVVGLALALRLAPGDEADDALRIRFPQGSGGVNQPEHLDADYLVMISLDGFRHDYMALFDTPNLDRIAAAGVRAEGVIPAFPVKTFPNHYTLATGLYPDAHGLVGNSFCARTLDACYSISDRAAVEDPRFYGGEPIWVTAETQGMVAASYFWVGTEAPVMGIQPTHWSRFSADIPYGDRVEQVLAWLAEPADARPHMITLYFEETDSKGHNAPTESVEMRNAVELVDRHIGDLLDGIAALPHGNRVHVLVTSDHGMAPFFADSTYVLPDLWDIPEDVDIVGGGSNAIVYLGGIPGDDEGDDDGDAAPGDTGAGASAGQRPALSPAERDRRLNALRDTLAALMPRTSVYRVGEMPERLHYSRGGERLGELVIIPDMHWSVSLRPSAERPPRDGFTHGWDPSSPEMRGLFVAMGPRIQPGSTLPAVENVHVYPLAAEILGLEPNPEIDGRLSPFRPVLRPAR